MLRVMSLRAAPLSPTALFVEIAIALDDYLILRQAALLARAAYPVNPSVLAPDAKAFAERLDEIIASLPEIGELLAGDALMIGMRA
jgi:hypothetical protein